jgi:hypothetical protein
MGQKLHVSTKDMDAFREWAAAHYGEDLVLFDGFETAILGVVEVKGRPPVVLYDRQRCIDILTHDGMDVTEAAEYLDFNVTDAYVGDFTPGFVNLWGDITEWVAPSDDA